MSPRARSEAADGHLTAPARPARWGPARFGACPPSVLDQISDVVIAFDPEGWVTYANHRAEPFLDP